MENGELKVKKDWELKKLGELCSFIGDGDWIESGDQSTEGIRLVQTGNVGEGIYLDKENRAHYISEETFTRLKCTEIFPGDCLISRLPEPVGRACIIPDLDQKMITAVDCTIIRFKENIQPQYFVYYSQSNKYLSDIDSEATGATRKRISRKNLEKISIPVPPLEEQKRIVKIMDEKFEQLETIKTNAQTNLQNAKDLFQSQLTKAFSNTTWEKKRLGDCGSFKNGMNFAATDSGYTIRSLGVGDFKDRYSIDDTETLSEISLKAAPSEDYLLHDGDIVFVRSNGNKELVGRCVLVYPKDIPTTYSGFCIRFRKDFDLLDADFLLHFMKAESSRKILNGKEGANISNLNQKILGDFEVPLPPLSEQKRIVKELDALSEKTKALQNIYEKMLLDCEELKQSYLCKAFAGEL